MNQIIKSELTESFKFCYVVPKSIEPKKFDSISKFQKTMLWRHHQDLPMELLYKNSKDRINWKKYNLKNIKITPENKLHGSWPPWTKQVVFIKYNTVKSIYDSIIKHKKPHTIIVRKKWLWGKKRIWKEIRKAWKDDEKQHFEEKRYYEFSAPLFSKDRRYARISIKENKRCSSTTSTIIYNKNNNGVWKRVIQYESDYMTRFGCQGPSVSFSN